MGYTHYFELKKAPTVEQWDSFKKRVLAMINNRPEKTNVAGGYYSDEDLIVSNRGGEDPISNASDVFLFEEEFCYMDKTFPATECISLNGFGDMSHEPFYLRKDGMNLGFSFCKTNRKPYDLLVCGAILIAAAVFGNDGFTFSSDGDWDEWEGVVDFMNEISHKTGIAIVEKSEGVDAYVKHDILNKLGVKIIGIDGGLDDIDTSVKAMPSPNIKKITTHVFQTSDGQEFLYYEDAADHDELLQKIKMYEILQFDVSLDGVARQWPLTINVKIISNENHELYANLIAQALIGTKTQGNLNNLDVPVWNRWEVSEIDQNTSKIHIVFDGLNGDGVKLGDTEHPQYHTIKQLIDSNNN